MGYGGFCAILIRAVLLLIDSRAGDSAMVSQRVREYASRCRRLARIDK
jgi:hypothetical protein